MTKKNTAASVTLSHPNSAHQIEVPADRTAMYKSQGWSEATPDAPKANASLKDWQAFARDQGFTDEQIEGKSRDELRQALA